MANLTNKYIFETFPSLVGIGTSGTSGVNGTLQPLTDGVGVELPIEISETRVKATEDSENKNLFITGYGKVINENGEWVGPVGVGGTSGTSGTSGVNGSSGATGSSGTSGVNGTSGTSGVNGSSGATGSSGTSGTSGVDGFTNSYTYDWSTSTSGAAFKKIALNNASYADATALFADSTTLSGLNLQAFFDTLASNNSIYKAYILLTNVTKSSTVQFRVDSIATVGNMTTFTGAVLATDGTDFLNNEDVYVAFEAVGNAGNAGTSGTSGVNGTNGTSGISGTSGTSGVSGTSGTSGLTGTSGTSGVDGSTGAAGTSGTSGVNGTSGTSGVDGSAGNDGTSGTSGTSGLSGTAGTSGTSGVNGISAGRVYYFNYSQTDPTFSVSYLSETPVVATQQIVPLSFSPNATLPIINWATDPLGFNIIPAGVQRFNLYYLKENENDNLSTYLEIQIVDGTGAPQLPTVVSPTVPIGWNGETVPYETQIDVIFPTTPINPSWIVFITQYVINNDNQNRNLDFYTEDGYYSFVTTSVGVVSGTSGTSGVDGTSGTSGTSGINGTEGTSGTSGTSGTTPEGSVVTTGPNTITGIWSGSQAAYDALGTYSATTLYFID